MSEVGSELSGNNVGQLQPEPSQTPSDESFVFNREITSEHENESTFDLTKDGTFDVNESRTPGVNKQLTVDENAEEKVEYLHDEESDVDHADVWEPETDGESTFVDEQTSERVSISLLSEKTEYLMSELEIAEWDRRMEELVSRLQDQQRDHERWGSSFKQRRLLALERHKRLKASHTRRVELYTAVTGYIDDLHTMLHDKNA